MCGGVGAGDGERKRKERVEGGKECGLVETRVLERETNHNVGCGSSISTRLERQVVLP